MEYNLESIWNKLCTYKYVRVQFKTLCDLYKNDNVNKEQYKLH